MIKIKSLKLPYDHSDSDLQTAVQKKLRVGEEDIASTWVIKRSLDARKGRPLTRVYTLGVELKNQGKARELVKKSDQLEEFSRPSYDPPRINKERIRLRPLIIGTGPAGLFAGLILAEAGLAPILLERGMPVNDRQRDVGDFWKGGKLNPESNVQFGEGGAGTFSDGKLRTRVKDRSQRNLKILEELVKAGAPETILFESKPHVGTSNLVKVMTNLRSRIEELGGEYRFNSLVTDLMVENGSIQGVQLSTEEKILAEIVVLAVGHSARDTFQMLHEKGVKLQPKPFSVGFRIEHTQELIDRVQYGVHAGHPALEAAEYQLSYKTKSGRAVYSFCMCPGGSVIGSSSELDTVVTNGMSQYARDLPNANSAIVAEVHSDDYGAGSLDGFKFQRYWERAAFGLGGSNYHAPVQLVTDFLAGQPSTQLGSVEPTYTPGVSLADLSRALPSEIIIAIREALPIFDQRMAGFGSGDAVLTGVETRTSSALRILRGSDFQSVSVRGLYPAGEGSGYAGGIMSSAIDGIKAAEMIIQGLD